MESLDRLFTKELSGILPDYVYRKSQFNLAAAIESILGAGGNGVFEAGTGIGKSFAYLIPALRSKSRVLISTGTRNLQDQLYLKDLPLLLKSYPHRRVALLKGRSNYLCPYRLNRNLRQKQAADSQLERLVEIRSWYSTTRTGDLTELLDPEDDPALMRMVTSSSDNCLGSRCPNFDECPLYRARNYAQQADLVVVNHHLLFADISQREQGLPSLLPDADAVIVDEAHQIPSIARRFFGRSISSAQLIELCRDLRTELSLLGNDDAETLAVVGHCESAVDKLRQRILSTEQKNFQQFVRRSGAMLDETDLVLAELAERVSNIADRSQGLAQCADRAARFVDQFALLTVTSDLDDGYVQWIDRTANGFVIHLAPLSIAEDMKSLTGDAARSWIFTSATLTVAGDFEGFTGEMGLSDATTGLFESPYDYASCVRGHVLASLPDPGDQDHTSLLVAQVQPVIRHNAGRTFFLFTSHRALRRAAALFVDFGHPVFVQGSLSKARLLEQFKRTERSILLATQSFWEGVDMKGADVRLLIIDKLPFPPPDDPLFQARSAVLAADGQNGFVQLSMPAAALSLRQGFGRLIRQESDRGLFLLGDKRVISKSYGRYFCSSLPPIQWLSDQEDAVQWLAAL